MCFAGEYSADASDYTLCREQFLLHFMIGWDKNKQAFPLKPAALCGFLFLLNLTHHALALLRSHHAVSLWSSRTCQEPQQESSPLSVCLLLTLRGLNLLLRVCPGEHNILPSHLFPDSHLFCPPVSGLTTPPPTPHVGVFCFTQLKRSSSTSSQEMTNNCTCAAVGTPNLCFFLEKKKKKIGNEIIENWKLK